MSLPEKHEYLYEAEGTFAIAARDKEWVEWILERSTADGITIDGVSYPLTLIDKDDFEALKKLVRK